MSSAVTDESPAAAKGLSSGSLGLWGNTVIGLASTAPAYSLAATLGYVVLAVGDKSPAMFLIAFVPMLLTAIAYRELNSVMPDCGTTFTWGAKALGPWVGWLGGWGVAVSGIIVLANVAEVAAVYFLRAFGLDQVAENRIAVLALGVGFIIAMTWVSYRGIVVSERLQNVLVVFQFIVLGGLSILALWKVYAGTAGPQAVLPEWSWFSPAGLSSSAIAAAVILCLFIYWGWDACLAVNEETKDLARTPGRAAVLATVILLVTYCLVAVAVQAYAGFGTTGIGLNNEANIDDVVTVLGGPMLGPVMAFILLLVIAVSATASTQTTILPTARGTLAMAIYKAVPGQFARVHPVFKTPSFSTLVMGITAGVFYIVLKLLSEDALFDSIASLGLAVAFYYAVTALACVVYFWRSIFTSARNFFLRGLFPLLGFAGMLWAFGISARDMLDPDYGYTSFGGIGGVFVIGVGMLALGVPLMVACAAKISLRPYFRGESLNRETPVLVPDFEPPHGGL
jgi:amino acid transporter